MRTQKNNPGKLILTIIFLSSIIITAGCNGQKAEAQNVSITHAKAKASAMDIHTAVFTGNMEVLKQHIAAGSDLNVKDPIGGSSPLISACLFGKTGMAKALIDAGADLKFQNNDGSTALHTAAFFCRPDIVRLLLNKGVDKTIKNKYGSTAYETVAGKFETVKSFYESLGKMLGPMGLKLDFAYIEKTRPVIAGMLK
ncbi:MAG: ankyrin repeat domain-containing protein [Ferruginibacter sp.]